MKRAEIRIAAAKRRARAAEAALSKAYKRQRAEREALTRKQSPRIWAAERKVREARADAELAVAEAIRRAAQEAHDWFYDPEHDRVTDPRLGEAILDLAPADALAEVQRIRDDLQKKDEEILDLRTRVEAAEAEKARLGRQLNTARYGQPDFSWALHKEAMLELQAERDAALARVEKLHHLITEASDQDFIWGALDNVHDAETTLDDYAAAVSRAIRGAMQITGKAE